MAGVTRVLNGIESSNTGISLDGKGGGDPELAFDNNYFSLFKQDLPNGNISYTYNTFQNLTYVGLLVNDPSNLALTYTISIWGSFDNINLLNIIPEQQITLLQGVTYWLKSANLFFYSMFQIRSTGNKPLELSQVYLYTVTNNSPIQLPIPSYFITPVMSFASFSPLKNNDGIDNFMQITRVEPDVITINNKVANMSLVINAQTYAQSRRVQSQNYQFTNETPKITLDYQGRQINFGISSTDYFQMGNWFFKAGKGAGQ